VAWDSICADEANDLCPICGGGDGGGTGDGGDSNCCVPTGGLGCADRKCEAAVCGVDAFCCNVAWDSICADLAVELCEECGGGGDGGSGDGGGGTPVSNCCVPNGGIGCDNPACQAAVCAIDSFCCNVAWDSICADEAAGFPECACP
jgi:hypothetical protein